MNILSDQARTTLTLGRLLSLLGIAALSLLLGSLFIGTNPIPIVQAFRDVLQDDPSVLSMILIEVRLPRALIAAVAGASLGLCGAVLQGL
ncbi:MAG: iron ABC transporter permease, partial [Gammaproteobacteria bacterium]|nr:iron ABC transporter permease [Gammaproteobacteria bacterium]